MNLEDLASRFFISYSGVKLPLKLVNEIEAGGLDNRNTFFKGYYDEEDRLVRCEKLVYGETELLHVYAYDDNGTLRQAEITDADGEVTQLSFDAQGQPE
ncbi:RHS repeat protein [Methylomonas sp. SURF-2]|uniref:RHS repeat protein n=1 Tax=Methylomonas subterranea TaxID=2952225 RepID=A0ABT1TIG6_9GAMM|nr:DUF6156 family protein [Methylomonas sp. SURF-2]MCQ8105266.1 RHS repeat protein [Methylomonas sp. SURF-2]